MVLPEARVSPNTWASQLPSPRNSRLPHALTLTSVFLTLTKEFRLGC